MKVKISVILLITIIGFYSNSIGADLTDYHLKLDGDSINEKMITETVEQYYIKGLQTRDFSLIRYVCIKDAILYGVRKDSSLNAISLDQWSKRFIPGKPPFKSLDYEILKVDYVGTAAQVKILFIINNKNHVHDFLNLLKISGQWKIVNIIDF